MKILKVFFLAIIIISALATVVAMIYSGRPWEHGLANVFNFILFGFWAISPYLFLAGFVKGITTMSELSLFSIFVLIVALAGNFIYYDIFFLSSETQTGSEFLYVPFLQWIICSVYFALSYVINRKKQKSDS